MDPQHCLKGRSIVKIGLSSAAPRFPLCRRMHESYLNMSSISSPTIIPVTASFFTLKGRSIVKIGLSSAAPRFPLCRRMHK